jgi:hypothetical protein
LEKQIAYLRPTLLDMRARVAFPERIKRACSLPVTAPLHGGGLVK